MRIVLLGLIALLLAVDGIAALDRWVTSGHSSTAPAAQFEPAELAMGDPVDRAVPAMPLVDDRGERTSLAAFRGKYVVLAPSMTLCHEVCPMTTAALNAIQQQVDGAGLARRAAVVEVTVDPWRDTPARLRAYERLTGVRFHMLTGSQAEIRRLWHFLGIAYSRVPQGNPPDRDWLTGRPERFDVQHTDAIFFLDPRGHLRIVNEGMPDVHGRLSPVLSRLLNDQGRHNLSAPQLPWTVSQARQDLWYLMGRLIPMRSGPATPESPNPAAARAALAGSPRALAALHAQAGQLLAGGEGALRARLAALRGHPVVVNEWASWCFPCRHEFPLFAAASAAYGKRVAFVGLNVSDSSSDARSFLAKHPLSYPSYSDSSGDAAEHLASLEGLPTTVFISAQGKVVATHPGVYASDAALANDIEHHALGIAG